MSFLDDKGHPSGGERIDQAAHDAIRLAHEALERFPDVVRRHKYIAGGAAISSSLVVLAGVAITRRIRGGQSSAEALASVTEEEIQGLRVVDLPDSAEVIASIEIADVEPPVSADELAARIGETTTLTSTNGGGVAEVAVETPQETVAEDTGGSPAKKAARR